MGPAASPDDRRSWAGVALALAAVVVVGALAYLAGRGDVPRPPDSASAEAGFARDMQVHHVQGVEMAMLIRDRTEDPDVRRLAYDIATTQSHQAGQLFGWLTEWNLRQLGSDPPMTWMMRPGRSGALEAQAGHTMDMSMGALMPGMATPAQMAELAALSGVAAERRFLQLMTAHHQGALDMAKAVLDRSDHPGTRTFANAVIESQQAEIDLMNEMLAARPSPPPQG